MVFLFKSYSKNIKKEKSKSCEFIEQGRRILFFFYLGEFWGGKRMNFKNRKFKFTISIFNMLGDCVGGFIVANFNVQILILYYFLSFQVCWQFFHYQFFIWNILWGIYCGEYKTKNLNSSNESKHELIFMIRIGMYQNFMLYGDFW